jgi:hypothetical protein
VTGFTNDNTPLLRPNGALGESDLTPVRPTPLQSISVLPHYTEEVGSYIRASVSASTRRAYQSDVRAFYRWGGTLPASAERVAQYLAENGTTLSPYTLARRLVALARAHRAHGFVNPCTSELVRATMRGIRRVRGLNRPGFSGGSNS